MGSFFFCLEGCWGGGGGGKQTAAKYFKHKLHVR